MTFAAEAIDPDANGAVADMWWDFGDGSEPEHVAETSHVYAEAGRYMASFYAVDDMGGQRHPFHCGSTWLGRRTLR